MTMTAKGFHFFCLYAIFAIAMTPLKAFAQAPQPIGTLAAVEGQVTFSGTSSAGGAVAKAQDPVYPYTTVRTGSGARALILLIDDTEITLGEDSEVTLDEFVFDPGDAQENKGKFSFGRGAFVYVSGMLADRDPPDVTLQTAYGSIGIRGTTVWGGPVEDGFGVFVEKGRILFRGDQGDVHVPQGAGTFLRRGAPPRAANAWPDVKISAMKQRLAFAQGREVVDRKVRDQMLRNVERRDAYRKIVWPYKPKEWRAPLDPRRGAPFTKDFRQQDMRHRQRLQQHDRQLRDGPEKGR